MKSQDIILDEINRLQSGTSQTWAGEWLRANAIADLKLELKQSQLGVVIERSDLLLKRTEIDLLKSKRKALERKIRIKESCLDHYLFG